MQQKTPVEDIKQHKHFFSVKQHVYVVIRGIAYPCDGTSRLGCFVIINFILGVHVPTAKKLGGADADPALQIYSKKCTYDPL